MIKTGFKKTKMFVIIVFIIMICMVLTPNVTAYGQHENTAENNKMEITIDGTNETVEDAKHRTITTNYREKQGNANTNSSVETEKNDSGSGLIASNQEQPIGKVEVSDSPIVQSRSRQQAHYISDDAKTVDTKKDIAPSVNNQQRKVLPNTGDNDFVDMLLFGITIIFSYQYCYQY